MKITITYDTKNGKVDYEVNVGLEEIKKYCVSCVGHNTFLTWSFEKQRGFYRAIEILYQEDFMSGDLLLENNYFMEWIKDYYKEYALCEGEEE